MKFCVVNIILNLLVGETKRELNDETCDHFFENLNQSLVIRDSKIVHTLIGDKR